MAIPTLEDILRDRIAELEEDLKQYLDTGLTPEEIRDRIELEKAFADAWEGSATKAQEIIRNLLEINKKKEADRDHWEREAKKAVAKLGEIRILTERK